MKRCGSFSRCLAATMVLACTLAAAAEEPQLLPPEQAFRVEAGPRAGLLRLTWTIADGYYLYRHRFAFASATPGIALAPALLPPGEPKHDEFFGDSEIYRRHATIDVPFTFGGSRPAAVELEVTSQGCADIGVCFPPRTETLTVALAPPGGAGAVDALSALRALTGGAVGAPPAEFLPPDEAFKLDALPQGPGALAVRWRIADGYYLYRHRFDFALAAGDGLALGAASLPPGTRKHDEYFGEVEVYYGGVDALLPVTGPTLGERAIALDVTYQGCADAGLCYPPITKRVDLTLPPGTGVSTSALPAAGTGTGVSELPAQDRLALSLEKGSGWQTLLVFFGFGLLLAFTPCVFPMIPILSSIIIGQRERPGPGRAFVLSATYVLAMALTYAAAGIVAGLFGANLQAAFQHPAVLVSFSIVFVILALAMFGAFQMQMPASWAARLTLLSNRQARGTYSGVAVMGLLSALIVGPCVAPPLAAALIYIGRTGDAQLGGAALFALSLGMGTPLLLIGVSAGHLLPRVGEWMQQVRVLFGLLLLAVAVYLLERIVPAAIAMFMWASLLIGAAVSLGALRRPRAHAGGWSRLRQASGLVLLVYGALVMVGGAAGGDDPLRPLHALTAAGRAERPLAFQAVKGIEGLERALGAARARSQPVMLDYYADWCVSCKEMERTTFRDAGVREALAPMLLLQADVTAYDEQDKALLGRFGLFGPPAILFFDPAGEERQQLRVVGYMDPESFRSHALRAHRPAS